MNLIDYAKGPEHFVLRYPDSQSGPAMVRVTDWLENPELRFDREDARNVCDLIRERRAALKVQHAR